MDGRLEARRLEEAVDLYALAQRYTDLTRWARREWAGPCPRCGGKDRFHVHSDGWWKCYRCHPRRARATAFLRWVDNSDFRSALARLAFLAGEPEPVSRRAPDGLGSRPVTPAEPAPDEAPAPQNPRWQARAQRECAAAALRLASPEGETTRAYLAGRGLLPITWQTWGLGLGYPWHPRLGERRPALVIPWRERGRVMAVQYRFVPSAPAAVQAGSSAAGDLVLDRSNRFSQKRGGLRRMYGVDLLGESGQTLVLVEGELNALSIWQVVRGYPAPHVRPPAVDIGEVDVVSFGSESQATSGLLRELARRYAYVLIWTDRPERGAEAAALLRGAGVPAQAVASPQGQDANDLLQGQELARFLARVLAQGRLH